MEQKKEDKKEESLEGKIKKSLHFSIMDGLFWSIMVGFGESFLSAFALFLNATNQQLGLLGSLPQALGSLSQLWSRRLMKLINSRKKLVMLGVLLSGLMYLPITLSFFFGRLRVAHLIIFICLYWIFSTIVGPAWSSWMGELVNKNERGAYFGKRNKIAGFATFFTFIIAGYILQQLGGSTTTQYLGYALLFTIAMISRLVSFLYISMKYEPGYQESPGSHFTFLEFVKKATRNNYGIFVIYSSFMNFAVFITAPFFIAYILKDLQMTYWQYTLIQAAAILVRNLSMPIWGKAMDRFGARKVLSLAGYLMPIVPFLWMLSRDFWYLIIVQFYSGLVWAAFDLATFTFILDVTSPQKRASCVAYYNVLIGITTLGGALAGGFILSHTPDQALGSKFLLLFLISSIIRYMSSLIFIPKIREVRNVEPIPYHTLFLNVITTIPSTGGAFSFLHELVGLPKLPVRMVKEISDVTRELSQKIRESAELSRQKRHSRTRKK
jgi:MFS family permease